MPRHEVGVVVDQVVGAVGNEETQREDQPGQDIEWPTLALKVLPGQQAADQPRVQRDRADRRARGDEPLGQDVQRVPLLAVFHLDELRERLAPHRESCVHLTSPKQVSGPSIAPSDFR